MVDIGVHGILHINYVIMVVAEVILVLVRNSDHIYTWYWLQQSECFVYFTHFPSTVQLSAIVTQHQVHKGELFCFFLMTMLKLQNRTFLSLLKNVTVRVNKEVTIALVWTLPMCIPYIFHG